MAAFLVLDDVHLLHPSLRRLLPPLALQENVPSRWFQILELARQLPFRGILVVEKNLELGGEQL
jgi:hypothetical protein